MRTHSTEPALLDRSCLLRRRCRANHSAVLQPLPPRWADHRRAEAGSVAQSLRHPTIASAFSGIPQQLQRARLLHLDLFPPQLLPLRLLLRVLHAGL